MIFAASILKGRTVKVPTFVVPGSTEVHADMLNLNLAGVLDGLAVDSHDLVAQFKAWFSLRSRRAWPGRTSHGA